MFTIMYNLPVNSSITVVSQMKAAGNYVKHPRCHQRGMKVSIAENFSKPEQNHAGLILF